MKTITIFLASSEELENDREAFGNLVRRLNKTYEKRGIHLELFDWEGYDAAYNDRRKQDEYNDQVRASDMFLAVFHHVAGRFTLEEFDVAVEEFRKKSSPRIYVYCKDLSKYEVASKELQEFQERLANEMGHFWSRYSNKDTMQLHFVLQLQMVENSIGDELTVENGVIVLSGQPVARMDRLPFACLNEDFQKMSSRLAELSQKIERVRLKQEKYPDDDDFIKEEQELLNEYNKLKEAFSDHQKDLFSTAKRVAVLQGEKVTDRMRRALEAFNEGKIREANIILDEAGQDGKKALMEYETCRELLEQKRANVILSINEIRLNISTIKSDLSISVNAKNAKIESLYEQVVDMAQKVDYDPMKYVDILRAFAGFLSDIAKYDKALEYGFKELQIRETVLGKEHQDTAGCCDRLGLVYHQKGDYTAALEYHLKALRIYETVSGKDHQDTAICYENIGAVYYHKGDYTAALEYLFKALPILESFLGKEHRNTATCYNNIGSVYADKGNYTAALDYYFKAMKIREIVLGKEHPDTATSYNNIGSVYSDKGNYTAALEYYFKAMKIREIVLGKEHPDTATSYNSIGAAYSGERNYTSALEYYFKATKIRETVLGKEHPGTATSYNNIGSVYYKMGDYTSALTYLLKALQIRESVLGEGHPSTAGTYSRIGDIYADRRDYTSALEYYFKTLRIRETVLGKEHPDTATCYDHIAYVYAAQDDCASALEYYFKAMQVYESVFGEEHPYTATSCYNIGVVYYDQGDYVSAREYFHRAWDIRKVVLGENHPETIRAMKKVFPF